MKPHNDFFQRSLAPPEQTDCLPSLLTEAIAYLQLFYQEQSLPKAQLQERLSEIESDYQRSHTYWQTEEELAYGAKVAWRNSSRCIGRIFWESLIVRDLRHLTTAEDIHRDRRARSAGNKRRQYSLHHQYFCTRFTGTIWNPYLESAANSLRGLSPSGWRDCRRSCPS